MSCFGHIQNESDNPLTLQIIEGRVKANRKRGRRKKKKWYYNFWEWTRLCSIQTKRLKRKTEEHRVEPKLLDQLLKSYQKSSIIIMWRRQKGNMKIDLFIQRCVESLLITGHPVNGRVIADHQVITRVDQRINIIREPNETNLSAISQQDTPAFREVNNNNLLGGQFLIFLPKKSGKIINWVGSLFWVLLPK